MGHGLEYGDVGVLEFKEVSFQYKEDEFSMLDRLSFEVDKGEFVSIIGTSGCGKSTIFRLINKLENPSNGDILVNGVSVKKLTNYSAFMPQKDLLFPWRTIEKNVMLPLEIQKISKVEMKEKAKKILDDVGLASYSNHYPKELSGGMKQRVSFARTLMTGSELLLLDEPFSALDSLTRIELQEWLIKEWQKRKQTVLFITHDVEEALFLSSKILIIKERPISKFDVYEVPLSYPRIREDMKNPEIVALKELLIQQLRQEGKHED